MHKIAVGQKVFIVRKVYRRSDVPSRGYEEVLRVGKKYFYVGNGYNERKFSIETLRESNTSNYHDQAYLSEADYEAEAKREVLIDNINSMVRGWGWQKGVPTDKLEAVYNILKEHE